MTGIPLRIAEDTGRHLRTLRRYSASGSLKDCPAGGYHNASADIGEWITTQEASGGGYWDVTGTAPAITVSPSIWHNSPHGWHGWIRNGELVDA